MVGGVFSERGVLGWIGRGREGGKGPWIGNCMTLTVQWTWFKSWEAPSIVVRSTELEGFLAHLVQTPSFTGPERFRNLPRLTQQPGTGWLFQKTVYGPAW